jgi:hypothetical protein
MGGHVLTEATLLGTGVIAYVRGFREMGIEVRYDPEIEVAIFRPHAAGNAVPPAMPA